LLKQINVGIIGTGWCGGIRANACDASPLVDKLYIAEQNPERLKELSSRLKLEGFTDDWLKLIHNPDIDTIIISATPETTHYPMALKALEAGKNVFLEKPIATTLIEADHLIETSIKNNVKFTIGYSQRFNAKYAYVKKSLEENLIGEPVTCLVSRHITRELGEKISARTALSPAAMEATHDLDFLLWCLQPRKPVKVYSQTSGKLFSRNSNTPDHQWIMVTLDDGMTITIGAGWILPLGYPNFSNTWIEVIGTDGSLFIDDTHKDIQLNTVKNGMRYPLSSMPGESVNHAFSGPMHNETIHFLEAIALNKPVLVKPEEARLVMDLYIAADISAETGEPVTLPRNDRG
jgi:predicted dehydrogenase|tara:strand:+ start:4496 stop:5539 length:1044 start_codon:yes stop_codon:yes gene_type:complete